MVNARNNVKGAICSLPGDDSWQVDGAGWLFDGAVLLAIGTYVAVGIVIGKGRGAALAAGAAGGPRIVSALRLHPHFVAWTETVGLAKDGGLFAANATRVRLGYPAAAGAAARQPAADPRADGISAGSRKARGSVQSQVSAGSRRSDRSERGGGGRSGGKKDKDKKDKGKTKSKRSKASGGSGGGGGKEALLAPSDEGAAASAELEERVLGERRDQTVHSSMAKVEVFTM